MKDTERIESTMKEMCGTDEMLQDTERLECQEICGTGTNETCHNGDVVFRCYGTDEQTPRWPIGETRFYSTPPD